MRDAFGQLVGRRSGPGVKIRTFGSLIVRKGSRAATLAKGAALWEAELSDRRSARSAGVCLGGRPLGVLPEALHPQMAVVAPRKDAGPRVCAYDRDPDRISYPSARRAEVRPLPCRTQMVHPKAAIATLNEDIDVRAARHASLDYSRAWPLIPPPSRTKPRAFAERRRR